MKGLKSLHIFLAAAAVAFLLPACGGGDDSSDNYISPEQFRAGTKGYVIHTSPEATFKGGVNGRWYAMTSAQGEGMFGQGIAAAGEFTGKDGYIMQGTIRFSNGSATQGATIAYYVDGGSTGTGYMYVSLTSDAKNCENELCHMMGCLSPQDVKYAGLTSSMLPLAGSTDELTGESESTELYLLPKIQRVLLVSMEGVSFVIRYRFTQGMCDIYLCYAKAYLPTDEDVGDGIDPQSDEGQRLWDKATTEATQTNVATDAAVSISRPYNVTFE